MSQPTPTPPPDEPSRRLRLNWIPDTLLHPRSALARVAESPTDTWLTPILLLSATALLLVFAGGPLRRTEAALATSTLPADFQYYSPEQQAQFMQAQAAMSGTTFIYVFPAIRALLEVWIGWPLVGSLLHLATTLFGGRATMRSMMNLVAWAGLPFAVRDLVRVVYVLASHRLIAAPGLSGLVSEDAGAMGLLASELLKLVDLYLIWHFLLLALAVRTGTDPGWRKAWASVLLTQVVVLLLQALPGFLGTRLASLTVIRPFLF